MATAPRRKKVESYDDAAVALLHRAGSGAGAVSGAPVGQPVHSVVMRPNAGMGAPTIAEIAGGLHHAAQAPQTHPAVPVQPVLPPVRTAARTGTSALPVPLRSAVEAAKVQVAQAAAAVQRATSAAGVVAPAHPGMASVSSGPGEAWRLQQLQQQQQLVSSAGSTTHAAPPSAVSSAEAPVQALAGPSTRPPAQQPPGAEEEQAPAGPPSAGGYYGALQQQRPRSPLSPAPGSPGSLRQRYVLPAATSSSAAASPVTTASPSAPLSPPAPASPPSLAMQRQHQHLLLPQKGQQGQGEEQQPSRALLEGASNASPAASQFVVAQRPMFGSAAPQRSAPSGEGGAASPAPPSAAALQGAAPASGLAPLPPSPPASAAAAAWQAPEAEASSGDSGGSGGAMPRDAGFGSVLHIAGGGCGAGDGWVGGWVGGSA